MDSFDELGVIPDLVEALAAEGIEVPTAFQRSALPVILRGNPLLAQAGPGAGTLIAFGVPLLQRVDPEAKPPGALVLCPSSEGASSLAASLSRLAQVTGHRVGALGSAWALPEISTILFSTPDDLLRAIRSSQVSLENVQAVVVDGFPGLTASGREALEILVESAPKEGQKVLLGQPLTEEAEAFGKAHFSRAVHLPPKAAQADAGEVPPQRGEVQYRVTGEDKEAEVRNTVGEILSGGASHVLLFFGTEDQAADTGDRLALHGYLAGAPGEAEFPVWLATEELKTRKILDEWDDSNGVVAVSVDVPADPDSLDRRHGGQERRMILVRSRELPHLRDVARRTGYRLVPAPEPLPTRVAGELDRMADHVRRTLKEGELAPHYLALEPLFREFAPAEVAAAALALLQQRERARRSQDGAPAVPPEGPRSGGPAPKAWVRLFVGVGEKDGVGPGDLLGAIAGEAGVEGSQVGKIEIRETFSLVEVTTGAADQVIRKLNGTSIRGRSVRVDHDRGGPRGRGGPGSRGGGRGGGGGRSGPGARRPPAGREGSHPREDTREGP